TAWDFWGGDPGGIRTHDLDLERVACWASAPQGRGGRRQDGSTLARRGTGPGRDEPGGRRRQPGRWSATPAYGLIVDNASRMGIASSQVFAISLSLARPPGSRSEERRVGKEGRSR